MPATNLMILKSVAAKAPAAKIVGKKSARKRPPARLRITLRNMFSPDAAVAG
jgi:hypothetical protein